ncbi:ABC transporter ATP-binding protein [Paenibacillus agricola]|uniref:ABC transporter ATP-binding protein n=1 Tax=Paenibacillus agricola TaxID=2716264 RepID=A0ABX0J1B1_9BACL|nr:ABC transporter ATP-binding protein [Paenibacillus agricola]NHN28573.1 ABC transporter ATP-binding protein [Paenibacillus agricola]
MIICEELVKIYKTDEIEVVALKGLNISITSGEMMAIIGNSGSGKSTLLNILGGLDRPSAGAVQVGEWNLLKISDDDLVQYKRTTVGFIWQNNARNLVPYLTALENVEMPMMLSGQYDRAYAKQLLEWVGLKERMGNKLQQLSGGEQQRVAIAISLSNKPTLLLADEPTGSVDSKTSDMIMDIFRKLNRELGVTIVIVTHDMELASKVDRVVAIRDGMTSTEFIKRNPNLDDLGSEGKGQSRMIQDVHEEYVVLDRAGRLQIPKAYLQALKIDNKASMEFDGEKIIIRPPKILNH